MRSCAFNTIVLWMCVSVFKRLIRSNEVIGVFVCVRGIRFIRFDNFVPVAGRMA